MNNLHPTPLSLLLLSKVPLFMEWLKSSSAFHHGSPAFLFSQWSADKQQKVKPELFAVLPQAEQCWRSGAISVNSTWSFKNSANSWPLFHAEAGELGSGHSLSFFWRFPSKYFSWCRKMFKSKFLVRTQRLLLISETFSVFMWRLGWLTNFLYFSVFPVIVKQSQRKAFPWWYNHYL